jgi:hypothetical protein
VYVQNLLDEDLGDVIADDLLEDPGGDEQGTESSESSDSEEENEPGIKDSFSQAQIR